MKVESLAFGPVPHPNATAADLDRMWTACQEPERPPDEWVMYHVFPDCHGCNIAKEAARRCGGFAP